jgi:hypothetical protein
MAVSKLQSVQRRAGDHQVVVAGQTRIDAPQSARLTPESLSPQWLPAATLAGHNPFADCTDSFGPNPNGSRAGRSVRIPASRPEREGMPKPPAGSTAVAARQSASRCYRPALAG